MSKPTREEIEEKLRAYWQRIFDETVEDARAEGCSDEVIAQITEVMLHTAASAYASQNGSARTGSEFYLMALGFHAQAKQHQGGPGGTPETMQ